MKSYDYGMAVLYPKIINAYTKFAQNCVYYKRNFSVLPRKHPTLLAKKAQNPYSLGMAKLVWQCIAIHCQTNTGSVRFPQTAWCAFLAWLWNEFGISDLLFWHADVHTKFAKIAIFEFFKKYFPKTQKCYYFHNFNWMSLVKGLVLTFWALIKYIKAQFNPIILCKVIVHTTYYYYIQTLL